MTPELMSEEEEDDNGFVRHRPSWRSTSMNRLIDKLDHRHMLHNKKTTAKPRIYGDEILKPTPSDIPSWMIKGDDDCQDENED